MKTPLIRGLGAAAMLLLLSTGAARAAEGDAKLIDIEKSLWAAWAKGDTGPFEKHLTKDTVNVTSGGITVGKAELMKDIGSHACKVASYSIGDVQVLRPAEKVAILVYSADQDVTCGDNRLVPRVHVTSVYVKRDGAWKAAAYTEAAAN